MGSMWRSILGRLSSYSLCKTFTRLTLRRSQREAWNRIALVVWDSKTILIFMIIYVAAFGWAGYRLFRGTVEGAA